MYTSANNGFLVRDASENQDAEQQFHSREESNNRPQLVLKFWSGAPPPPPTGEDDTTAPDTTITGSPLAPRRAPRRLHLHRRRQRDRRPASLTFECQLDVPETPRGRLHEPARYTGLAEGSHTFRVRGEGRRRERRSDAGRPHLDDRPDGARDGHHQRARRASATSTSATLPVHRRRSPARRSSASSTAAAFAACTSPKTYTGLAVGSHTFQVRAMDAAGNIDADAGELPVDDPAGATVDCGTAADDDRRRRLLDRPGQPVEQQGHRLDPQGDVEERQRQHARARPVHAPGDAGGLRRRHGDAAAVTPVGRRERRTIQALRAQRDLDRDRCHVGEPAGDGRRGRRRRPRAPATASGAWPAWCRPCTQRAPTTAS